MSVQELFGVYSRRFFTSRIAIGGQIAKPGTILNHLFEERSHVQARNIKSIDLSMFSENFSY